MPNFYYNAVHRRDGHSESGELEATDEAAVAVQLQKKELIPIRISQANSLTSLGSIFTRPRSQISAKEINVLTKELSTLLESGLPLDRALQILIGLTEDTPKINAILTDIQKRVRGGATFSESLEIQNGIFNRLYVNMVRAGEASGSLEHALKRLSEYLERSAELQESVTSALVYPGILVTVAVLSVTILLAFVVPQFTQLFADMGAKLPIPTQIVIAAGDIVRGYWWVLLTAIIFGIAIIQNLLKRPHMRLAWHKNLLTWPILGDLLWKKETARFCNTLATLLENGMPLLGALSLAKEVVENRQIAVKLDSIGEALKRGKGLAGPLTEAKVFPKLALQLIRVGEESGHLDPMLTKVAHIYEQETRSAIQRALTLLEPALIIVLGAVIAFIIISILMAILGANDLIV